MWLDLAQEDLKICDILLHEGALPRGICFHAQQVAEKYLKGYIAYQNKNIRKVHDLEELLQECVSYDPEFNELKEVTVFLNGFYEKTRYPGDMRALSIHDAERAFASAQKIKDFVMKKIKENE